MSEIVVYLWLQVLVCSHHMVAVCISDGLMQDLGFLLLLLVGKELNMLLACTCLLMHSMSLWGQASRAVLASLGFIWLMLPLCLHFIEPPPHNFPSCTSILSSEQ